MALQGFPGAQGRQLASQTRQILENYLAHDLEPSDRQALQHAERILRYTAFGGAVVGPICGVSVAHVLIMRRAARFALPGQKLRYPPGGFALTLGAGFLCGALAADLGLALAFRYANNIIEREGNPDRIARAMQAASAEILRKQADAIEASSAR